MILTFTAPGAALAAVAIIADTSLQYLVSSTGPIRAVQTDDEFSLEVDLYWRWSSGEKLLVQLVSDLATMGRTDLLPAIREGCDHETYLTVRRSLTLLGAKAAL